MRRRGLVSCLVIAAAGMVAAQAPVRNGTSSSGLVAVTSQNGPLLRSWDATVDAMRRDGNLVLSRSRADTVLSGRTHERYQQYVNGIRVVGGELTRQISGGVTTSILGELQNVSGIADRPELSEDAARDRFRALSRRELPDNRPVELVILTKDDGSHALAYTTHVWTDVGWMRTYLDAASGEVLLEYNDLQTQAAVGTGVGVLGDTKKISTRLTSGRYLADDALRPPELITYDMQGNLARTDAYLDGFYDPTSSDIASDSDNTWTDPAAVDAHVYLGYTYDYYFKRFGRKGLDDRNVPIYAVTHPVRRADIFSVPPSALEYFDNAFWCSGCGPRGLGAMLFGEGLPPNLIVDGQTVDYLAGALDVVAHELTHGLTDYTSELAYRNESGALNESYSDIVGTSVEFFYQTPGNGTRQADYLIGEDVFRPGGLRSMSNPAAFGDPDHYSKRYTGTADSGGVHTNSGIPNQAFYLAVEGGTNRTSGLGVTGVGGANREQVEKAFYRAFAFMLPSSATFSAARAATIQAARDLYGAGSAAERAITQAWTAVGVN